MRADENVCRVHGGAAIAGHPDPRVVGEYECEVAVLGLQKPIDFSSVVGPGMVGRGGVVQAFDLLDRAF